MVAFIQQKEFAINVTRDTLLKRVSCFFQKHNISVRRVTHTAQLHRSDVLILNGWKSYIQESIDMHHCDDNNVVNIDETNINFDLSSAVTFNKKGKCTITVKCTGSSQRCTVLLAVTKNGIKLRPYIIFKNKINNYIVYFNIINCYILL